MKNPNNPWGGFALPLPAPTLPAATPVPAPVIPPAPTAAQPLVGCPKEAIEATLLRHGLVLAAEPPCGGDPETMPACPQPQLVAACPKCDSTDLQHVHTEMVCAATDFDFAGCAETDSFFSCSTCKGVHVRGFSVDECGNIGLYARMLDKKVLAAEAMAVLDALTPRSDTPIRKAVLLTIDGDLIKLPSMRDASNLTGIPYHQVRAVLLRGGGDLPLTADGRKYTVRWAAPQRSGA
jgi:hypothetical protein